MIIQLIFFYILTNITTTTVHYSHYNTFNKTEKTSNAIKILIVLQSRIFIARFSIRNNIARTLPLCRTKGAVQSFIRERARTKQNKTQNSSRKETIDNDKAFVVVADREISKGFDGTAILYALCPLECPEESSGVSIGLIAHLVIEIKHFVWSD